MKVIAGTGRDPGDGYEFVSAAGDGARLSAEQRKASAPCSTAGRPTKNFNKYRAELASRDPDAHLEGVDVTFVHNIFTMHFNLALTRALHDLAAKRKMVAWIHDLTATSPDYALPNPTQPPWSLVRSGSRALTYIATSDLRSAEAKIHLKLPVAPQVIPNMVDPARIFGCTPEIRKALPALEIPWRDFVFLLPARVIMHKNVGYAIDVIEQARRVGPQSAAAYHRAEDREGQPRRRRTTASSCASRCPRALRRTSSSSAIISLRMTDEVLRNLYQVSDCLLFPSKQEGFGLPVVEAAMPCIACRRGAAGHSQL